MSKDVCWTEQQREAIEERRAELLVSASAGSGKTAVLIERVLRATLADDEREAIPLDRMLIVTFTNAAASELRARLGRELAAEIARRHAQGAPLDPVRRQLALLPRAQISTLHSFCAEVIRRYGYLRGVSYGRLLDEDEADLLRHELAGRMLDRELGGGSSGIRELGLAWGGRDGVGPEDLSTVRSAKGLRGIMLNLHAFRCSLVEPEAWYGKYAGLPPLDPGQFDPGHALVQALCAELKEWANQAIANDRSAAGLIAPAEPDAIVLALIERRRPVLESLDLSKGWDEALACIDQLYQKQDDLSQKPTLLSSYKRDIDDQGLKAVVERLARSLRNEAAEWRQLFGEPWAELARRENRTQELTQTLWRLTVQFDEEYSSYKGERGVLDFDDQQRWALKILAADPVDGRFPRDGSGWIEPSEAARELRARFSAVLVDEYQDINAVQDAIVNLATADAPVGEDGAGRPRFVVGDLKQSIYAFRLAEPELFRETRLRLDGAATNSGRTVALTTNFRSRPKLLGAINHVFQGLMDHALGGEEYDENRLEAGLDYDALFTDLDAKPLPDSAARLHLVDLAGGGAEDSGDGDEEVGKQEAVYLRVAAVLKEIHAEGRMVFDPESGVVRPVAWRDMVVLLRSMLGRIETLKAVFDKAGVPYYAPGRSGFYERPEVADALSLLRVIDNPRQDVALAAVLRGPALGFTPQELLTVARQDDGRSEERAAESHQRRDLWARLQLYLDAKGGASPDGDLRARLHDFVEQLNGWRDAARREPLPEVIWRVYHDTGLLAAAAGLKHGGQRLANLIALHDMSRRFAHFQSQGVGRFLRFLALNRQAAGDLGEAPMLSEAEDVVRVMSVHQAKGLEFPVVIIPDLQREFGFFYYDLGDDVLWHRRGGIGGRFVDLRSEEPLRAETLGMRMVKRLKRVELASEELRLLYVAMTRARERLELVALADDAARQKLSGEHPDVNARCWLDWVGNQLAPAIASAAEANGAACMGEDNCWEVVLHGAAAPETEGAAPDEVEFSLSPAELQAIRERLSFAYQFPGSAKLPSKVTVTHLAHLPETHGADDEGTSGMILGLPRKSEVPQPRFLADMRQPTSAEVGSATHRLLSELDFATHSSAEAVAGLRDELAAAGKIEERAAKEIDCGALAQMAAVLDPLLAEYGGPPYRELPVALLVPPDDTLCEFLGVSREHCAPGDRIYVQGIIDLLLVAEDRLLVIDYKTDRGASAEELRERYARQLGWYCRAVGAMLPGREVRWAIYGLGGAGLVGPLPA